MTLLISRFKRFRFPYFQIAPSKSGEWIVGTNAPTVWMTAINSLVTVPCVKKDLKTHHILVTQVIFLAFISAYSKTNALNAGLSL